MTTETKPWADVGEVRPGPRSPLRPARRLCGNWSSPAVAKVGRLLFQLGLPTDRQECRLLQRDSALSVRMGSSSLVPTCRCRSCDSRFRSRGVPATVRLSFVLPEGPLRKPLRVLIAACQLAAPTRDAAILAENTSTEYTLADYPLHNLKGTPVRIVSSLILLHLLSILLFSQQPTPAEPEQIGIPYLVEAATGKFLPLERQRVNSALRMRAMGFGGARGVVQFDGKASPIRVSAASVRLVVRLASMPPMPGSEINLDVLVTKKKTREIVQVKAGSIFAGGGAQTTRGESDIDLKFRPSGNSVLFMEPSLPLKPGEYVVTLKSGGYAYLFGVD